MDEIRITWGYSEAARGLKIESTIEDKVLLLSVLKEAFRHVLEAVLGAEGVGKQSATPPPFGESWKEKQ